MSKQLVVERLVQYGRQLYKESGYYTTDRAAERFVKTNPNAWLFGVIFDQGIPYERAWAAPYILKQRLGHFNMRRIAKTPIAKLRSAIKGAAPGDALHRYVRKIPLWLKKAAIKTVREYGGDAANIWKECRTGIRGQVLTLQARLGVRHDSGSGLAILQRIRVGGWGVDRDMAIGMRRAAASLMLGWLLLLGRPLHVFGIPKIWGERSLGAGL